MQGQANELYNSRADIAILSFSFIVNIVLADKQFKLFMIAFLINFKYWKICLNAKFDRPEYKETDCSIYRETFGKNYQSYRFIKLKRT